MCKRLKKFKTRWMRWLGQKTRRGGVIWVDLLDTNWMGWADKVLNEHNIDYTTPNLTPKGVKDHYTKAIQCATMQELLRLDNLYAQDIIENSG